MEVLAQGLRLPRRAVHPRAGELIELAPLQPSEWHGFEQLVRRHHKELRGFLYRLLGAADVDDVLQEAYLRAFRAYMTAKEPPASPRSWLLKIAYRCAVDEWRRQRRRSRAARADIHGEALGGASVERLAFVEALRSLTPEQRVVVILVCWQGFDYVEAGEILGIPAGTVGSRLSIARASLRRALTETNETENSGKRKGE